MSGNEHPRIRPLVMDDILDVEQIEKACFVDPWTTDVFEVIAVHNDGVSVGHKKKIRVFVMEHDEEILGYVAWVESPSKRKGRILNIAVRPINQRRGLGTKLLLFALEQMRNMTIRNCTLEVRQSNRPARALYELVGMKASGRVPLYYENEDAILYSINL